MEKHTPNIASAKSTLHRRLRHSEPFRPVCKEHDEQMGEYELYEGSFSDKNPAIAKLHERNFNPASGTLKRVLGSGFDVHSSETDLWSHNTL